jgi:hypothetical protein
VQALREEREQRELNTDAFRGRLLDAGYVPLLRHLAAVNTLGVHALLADIVLALSMNAKHRGKLVQQVLLLDLACFTARFTCCTSTRVQILADVVLALWSR